MTMLHMADGRQLNYLDVGNGPVLLLLHGWAMSSGVFNGLVDDLAKDFRLLVPDLRGHGYSDAGTAYTLNDFATDMISLFNSLELNSCNLIGWSFGGQIAMQLVADAWLPVKRLIVVSSTPKFCQATDWRYGLPEVKVRAMQRQFRRDADVTLAQFRQMMFAGEQKASVYIGSASRQTVLPGSDAGAQTLETLKITDIRSRLSGINIPTMVHHGQADTIIPASAGEYIAENIPVAELVVWDEVGHAPFISCPAKSLALWKEFLQ